MKKQKVERKQDPHFIRTYWWDLKQTAADLKVPVSIVVQAMEITETNRRDVIINHVRQWTPVNTKQGAPINLPLMTKNEPKSLEQIRKEGNFNKTSNTNINLFGGKKYQWPKAARLAYLEDAVIAGIKIDLDNDEWWSPGSAEEYNKTVEQTMLPYGLQEKHVPFKKAFIGKDVNEEPVENYLNRKEELGKDIADCDYIRETETLTTEEVKEKYGDYLEIGHLNATLKGISEEEITSIEQPNAGQIFGGYIKTELIDVNNLRASLTPDECYKRFVYEVTEIKQGFWSKFRRARHFRLEIIAKGETIEVIPQWIHANMGLQGYDKCKVELVGTVNKVK